MFETLRMLTSVITQVNGQFPVCGNHSPCFEVRITILVNQAKCATIAQSFIHVMLFDELQQGFFLPSFTIFRPLKTCMTTIFDDLFWGSEEMTKHLTTGLTELLYFVFELSSVSKDIHPLPRRPRSTRNTGPHICPWELIHQGQKALHVFGIF